MTLALSSALLHFVWQGALIAMLLAVTLHFAQRSAAQTRYVFACGALLLMALSFGATFLWMLPSSPTVAAGPAASGFAARIVLDAAPPFDGQGPQKSLDWIVMLWLTGVTLFYGYRIAGWFAAQRLRRSGVCIAPESWQQRVQELSRRVRLARPVLLLESTLAKTPLTLGTWRPVILVPLGLLAGLPSEQVEALLLHELAHIARRDYLINLIQNAIEGLLFFHPAVWWVSRQIRAEREFCCDDLVIAATADTESYVQALHALEQQRDFAHQAALAASSGPLVLRIRRLLSGSAAPRGLAGPSLGLLLLATCAALVAWQPEPAPLPEPTPMPAPEPAPAPQQPEPQRPAPEPAQTRVTVGEQGEDTAQQSQPVAPPPSERQRRRLAEARLKEELETPYKKWLDEEVRWVISNEERAAFNSFQTDDERQKFVEQFWQRRDPSPDTEPNELREEHYRRIAWANDRFSSQLPGWKTDRGQIYIKFGPPDEIDSHPSPGPGVRDPAEGGGNTTFFAYERWRYRYIEGVGRDVIIEFVDKTMTNEYRMTFDPSEKDALLQVQQVLRDADQKGPGVQPAH